MSTSHTEPYVAIDPRRWLALGVIAVVIDVARHRGVDCLPAGSSISASEIQDVLNPRGLELRRWDVALRMV